MEWLVLSSALLILKAPLGLSLPGKQKRTDLAAYSICQLLMTLHTVVGLRTTGVSYSYIVTSISAHLSVLLEQYHLTEVC